MRTLLRVVPVAATVALGLAVVPGTPAAALSCVGAETVLADADRVFSGRIIDSANGHLLVEVEQVWQGGPVEERVWLRVDLPGWSAWADRDGAIPDGYSSPKSWVFAPDGAAVNPCISWPANGAQVEHLTPSTTTEPTTAAPPGHPREAAVEPSAGEWLEGAGLVGGAGAFAAAAAVLLRRRKQGAPRADGTGSAGSAS